MPSPGKVLAAGELPRLASMTGFARASAVVPVGTLAWEVRSVNGKGLDIRVRLPPGFDGEDAAFRARIGAAVLRGSVQATLTLQRTAAVPEVRIDTALIRRLLDAARAAVPPGIDVAPPTLDGLLAIRGVVEIVEQPESGEQRVALVHAAHEQLAEALRDVVVGRRAEGAALGSVLNGQLAAIDELTDAAEAAPGRHPDAVKARLARTVKALAGTGLDPDRLHAEAVLMAARADVQEEIDRLRLHASAARGLLAEGGAIGRRLDFLAQELAREASTLCAKSADAALTAIGLDLRTRVDQFREQVQNLE